MQEVKKLVSLSALHNDFLQQASADGSSHKSCKKEWCVKLVAPQRESGITASVYKPTSP